MLLTPYFGQGGIFVQSVKVGGSAGGELLDDECSGSEGSNAVVAILIEYAVRFLALGCFLVGLWVRFGPAKRPPLFKVTRNLTHHGEGRLGSFQQSLGRVYQLSGVAL